MAPNPSVSGDTLGHVAALDSNNQDVRLNAPNPYPHPSPNDGVQESGSSSAWRPPSYFRKISLDDPFRDGDASGGYVYPNNNGMQKGLGSATATQVDPSPATIATLVESLPPIPVTNADPFLGGTIVDGSLPSPNPFQPPGLKRGLQIPSRVSKITWGFSFPEVLAEQGVDKPQWRLFKRELESFARLSISQRLTCFGIQMVLGHFITLIPSMVVGWKMEKNKQHENLHLAYRCGHLKIFEDRWNDNYFHPLGLHIRVEPPGIGRMEEMDVASSKLFRYQQKTGTSSPSPGIASEPGDKKEHKYERKEGRYRMAAVRKGRIIVLPWKTTRTDSGDHNGQSQGVTSGIGPVS